MDRAEPALSFARRQGLSFGILQRLMTENGNRARDFNDQFADYR